MSNHRRPRSLLEAVLDKYECKEPLHIEIFVPKTAPGKTDSGNLILPRELILDKCDISHAGVDGEIASLQADVTVLDLAGNLLTEWREVFRILDQFPCVTFLNVSCNPLTVMMEMPESKVYDRMMKLVLNSLRIPWNDVQALIPIFPSLEELHVSLNDFRHITIIGGTPPCHSLRVLHINRNGLSSWEDVDRLGRFFPGLKQLCMLENPVGEISIEGERGVADTFPHLEVINISDTAVASWQELEKLRRFPKLCAIRLKGIPLLEGYDEADRRNLVLGYLPNVMMLNGSEVKPSEREVAEKAFLRHYVDRDEKPTRYDELVATYGVPTQLADIDLSPQTSVEVLLRFGEKSLLQKVDVRWTLQQLKKELVEFVGEPPKNFRVFLNDPEAWYVFDEMKLPAKKILSYGVKDGVEILIELKPAIGSKKGAGSEGVTAKKS